MCQIRQSINPTTPSTTIPPTTTTPSPNLCPESLDNWQWIPFDGNCYKLVDTAFEWEESQRFCSEDGIGDLVSIHSKEENDFVGQLMEDNGIETIHIGGFVKSDNDITNDKWAWSDGTSWNYTRWYPENPFESPYDDYFCVYLQTDFGFRWCNNTRPSCEARRSFICKTNQSKHIKV